MSICVQELGFPVRELYYDVVVSTLASGSAKHWCCVLDVQWL